MSCSPPSSLVQDSLGANSVTLVTWFSWASRRDALYHGVIRVAVSGGVLIIGWDFLQSNGGTVNDLLGFTPLTEEQRHCSYD